MQVQILLFAHYADRLGAARLDLELPAGASVRDAVVAVHESARGALDGAPLTAVNERYAAADHPLADGDTLALLPPVAGG